MEPHELEQEWPLETKVHWKPAKTWAANRNLRREGTVVGYDFDANKVQVQYVAMPELGKRKTISVPPERLKKIEQFTV